MLLLSLSLTNDLFDTTLHSFGDLIRPTLRIFIDLGVRGTSRVTAYEMDDHWEATHLVLPLNHSFYVEHVSTRLWIEFPC